MQVPMVKWGRFAGPQIYIFRSCNVSLTYFGHSPITEFSLNCFCWIIEFASHSISVFISPSVRTTIEPAMDVLRLSLQ